MTSFIPPAPAQLLLLAADAYVNMWFFIYSLSASNQFLISLLFIKDMEQVIK